MLLSKTETVFLNSAFLVQCLKNEYFLKKTPFNTIAKFSIPNLFRDNEFMMPQPFNVSQISLHQRFNIISYNNFKILKKIIILTLRFQKFFFFFFKKKNQFHCN